MKKAIIIHGWDGKPKHGWYPWLKNKLESKGFSVELPEMPNADKPKIEEWLNTLKNLIENPDEETYFIGHSVGCQTILRYLENAEGKADKVILIAPWMHLDKQTIKEEGTEVIEIARPWMETPIDFDKVKEHAGKFICFFSDDDYYVPLSDKDIFKEKLGAEIIIEHEKGHFTQDDGIKEMPELLSFFN